MYFICFHTVMLSIYTIIHLTSPSDCHKHLLYQRHSVECLATKGAVEHNLMCGFPVLFVSRVLPSYNKDAYPKYWGYVAHVSACCMCLQLIAVMR